jgi:DNA polymerase
MAACNAYLEAQLALLHPRLLITLGNVATRWILRTSEGITRLRGRWFDWRGIRVMPMYHPSYLLRNASRAEGSPKHQTWMDIQEVAKMMNAL